MVIDVHAHALHEGFLAKLCDKPAYGLSAERDGKSGFIVQRSGDRTGFPGSLDTNLHRMDVRLESLRRREVDLQLVGPPPGFLCWPGGGAPDIEAARALNKQLADVVSEGEGRLAGMAVVAFGEPERAADELRITVDKYGFPGAMIPSSVGGTPLDDPRFDAVLSAFEDLGLLVFMHPARVDYMDPLEKYRAYTIARFPHETALSATRLIFSGAIARHPGLKLVLSHGGGNLMVLMGRLDAAYNADGWEATPATHESISRPPRDYFEQLFVDTCVLNDRYLRLVVPLVGADRVMFGSDYPFEIGDPEGELALPAIDELGPEDREKVLGGNAASVLGTPEAAR